MDVRISSTEYKSTEGYLWLFQLPIPFDSHICPLLKSSIYPLFFWGSLRTPLYRQLADTEMIKTLAAEQINNAEERMLKKRWRRRWDREPKTTIRKEGEPRKESSIVAVVVVVCVVVFVVVVEPRRTSKPIPQQTATSDDRKCAIKFECFFIIIIIPIIIRSGPSASSLPASVFVGFECLLACSSTSSAASSSSSSWSFTPLMADQTSFFGWFLSLVLLCLSAGWTPRGEKKRSNIWQCRSDVAKNRTTLLLLLFLLFLLLLRQRQTASISKPSHSFIHSCLGSWDWDCSTSSSSSCAAQNVQKSPDWFSMPLRYRPRNWVLLGICLLLYL